MIDLYNAIVFTRMTDTPHGASMTVFSLVLPDVLSITRSSFPDLFSDPIHPLSHRTIQTIQDFIIMEAVITKGFDSFLLLFVKRVILNVSFNIPAFQKLIVFI